MERPPLSVLKLYMAMGPEALGGLLGCPQTHQSDDTGNWLFSDGSTGPYTRAEVIEMLESVGFHIQLSEHRYQWSHGLIATPPGVAPSIP